MKFSVCINNFFYNRSWCENMTPLKTSVSPAGMLIRDLKSGWTSFAQQEYVAQHKENKQKQTNTQKLKLHYQVPGSTVVHLDSSEWCCWEKCLKVPWGPLKCKKKNPAVWEETSPCGLSGHHWLRLRFVQRLTVTWTDTSWHGGRLHPTRYPSSELFGPPPSAVLWLFGSIRPPTLVATSSVKSFSASTPQSSFCPCLVQTLGGFKKRQ